jgi:uncharacterized membrane protein
MVCWVGYGLVADSKPWRDRSMNAVMSDYRRRWMLQMLERENRMLDVNILGNLLNGAAFFASTAILAVGGLFALLGATDKAIEILSDLPLAVETPRSVWEMKVLLLITILVFAFFKFAWAFRLFNNCSVLIGATPAATSEDPDGKDVAERAARINALASRHFNRGLRAYYFTMAGLAWFVHPALFMVAATWVIYVLFRRDFRSRSLGIVRDPL